MNVFWNWVWSERVSACFPQIVEIEAEAASQALTRSLQTELQNRLLKRAAQFYREDGIFAGAAALDEVGLVGVNALIARGQGKAAI